MKEKADNYWKIYQEINQWIKFSDTKAGILVTIYGVLLTIIYTNGENVYNGLTSSTIVLILSILFAILSIISIYFAFKCLNPRLKNENPKSVLYFGQIAKYKNYEDYLSYSEKVFKDENSTNEQLAEQVYVNSKTAWEKLSNVSIAIRLFFVSMSLLVIIMTIYFIML